MADTIRIYKRLDDAVALRHRPDLQAVVLRSVAGALDHLAGDLMAEARRLAPRFPTVAKSATVAIRR